MSPDGISSDHYLLLRCDSSTVCLDFFFIPCFVMGIAHPNLRLDNSDDFVPITQCVPFSLCQVSRDSPCVEIAETNSYDKVTDLQQNSCLMFHLATIIYFCEVCLDFFFPYSEQNSRRMFHLATIIYFCDISEAKYV